MANANAHLAERLLLPGSPFELTDSPSSHSSGRTFRHAPSSLNGIYRRAAGLADQVYLHCAERDFTYREVLCMAAAIQSALRERHGVLPGERVGLLLDSSPAWIASFIAITAMGAVAVLMGATGEAAALARSLAHTRCAVGIVEPETAAVLAECGGCSLRGILVPSPGECAGGSTSDHLDSAGPRGQASKLQLPPIDPEQEAVIAFTTGSTSLPKAVVSSHRAIITGMFNMMLSSALAAIRERLRRPGVSRPASTPDNLLLSPLDHVSGYSQVLLMMHVGGRITLLPKWNAAAAVRLISRQQITGVSGANVLQLREVLRTTESSAGDISSLASIGIHGQAVNAGLLGEISRLLPEARPSTGYGLTETNGSVCAAVGADLSERPGTCGPPVPSVEARIVDECGGDVPLGSVGEIWLRGTMLLSGYCDADGTPRSPLKDGWLATGDHGRMDAAGFLYLHERRQDIVRYDGRKISLRAVEKLACDSHLIDEAAALYVPGAGATSRLLVAVVPRRTHGFREEHVLERLLQEPSLAGCRLSVVELVTMPRLRSGKIDRNALRRQLQCCD